MSYRITEYLAAMKFHFFSNNGSYGNSIIIETLKKKVCILRNKEYTVYVYIYTYTRTHAIKI